MADKRYLSCAETAKLVRKALKEKFPGIKFSVRSKTYSGGASITVSWTDGPTTKQVDAVTDFFEGASFDGMIDLKSYHDAILNGERVHFGADYVFSNRHYSVEFTRQVGEAYAAKTGWEIPEIWDSGGFKTDYTKTVHGSDRQILADWFNRELWATSEAI